MNKLIVIAGPTASGKSAVAVELAKLMDTEIVSADSMQIYKGFNIGTAKITEEEKKGVKHHLIDFVSPSHSYSVNEYINDATSVIEEIHKAGHIPVLAGGTGLYINSLIYNFSLDEHKEDLELREALTKLYFKEGSESLVSILREFDPASLDRIHPNNYRRLIRAIEIYKVSGITMTEQIEKTKNTPKKYDVSFYVLSTDRAVLYERINKRVDKMVEMGLLDEVRGLLNSQIPKNSTSLQAIGYKEFIGVLSGEISEEEAIEAIKQESRNYAKRQLTWFRRNEEAVWIDTDNFNNNPMEIAKSIYENFKMKG